MITDIIKYFSKYPERAGVLHMFVNSTSDMAGYNALKAYVQDLPEHGVIPDIQYMAVGQSMESLTGFLNSITGCVTYLLVDFGEINSSKNNKNTISDTMKMAVTVAMRVPDGMDIIEESIASANTLELTNRLRAHLMRDSRDKVLGSWFDLFDGRHDLVPFVTKELQSIGWTIMFNASATDMLDVTTIMHDY